MPKRRIRVKPHLPSISDLIEEEVEGGLRGGWYRAHKHHPAPSAEHIWAEQKKWIMSNFYEAFEFVNLGKGKK